MVAEVKKLSVIFFLFFLFTSNSYVKGSNNRSHGKHFVLVHGGGHGAWCWYKTKTLLESQGHQVTALDMAASGINTKKLQELRSLLDYTQPLIDFMASLKPKEKVILVGHSLGGMNLAFAMDKFPEKISVAIFVAALMPDAIHLPNYVLEELLARTPMEDFLDTQFSLVDNNTTETSILSGPKFLSAKLYQLSPLTDLTLGKMMQRPISFFTKDLAERKKFSEGGYGSVVRVYIVCKKDNILTEDFQRWMIKNYPVAEVKEIEDADHMAMFSKPEELGNYLLEIAQKYT